MPAGGIVNLVNTELQLKRGPKWTVVTRGRPLRADCARSGRSAGQG